MRKKPEYGLGRYRYQGRCRYQGRNVVANAPAGTLAACGGVLYFAAVKVPSLESTPGISVSKILPAGAYVSLRLKEPMPNRVSSWEFLCHTFLPKFGLVLLDPLEIDHFGETRRILIPVCKSK